MMKKASWIMVLLSMVIISNLQAQKPTKNKEDVYNLEDLYDDDPYYWSYTKEIGVNFTPLISKFVPFNLGQNNAGLIGLKWKKYYSKRAFRINFGANINEINVDSEENLFLYFGLGIETRHPITKDKKWAYTSSFDLFLRAAGEVGILGLSKGYGFEYHFTKRIFISTEAALNVGLDFDQEVPIIEFQLPLAIFVNVRLY
ncbi:MAG: hypothetical protein U0T36_01090 [Saprospiraceae bacterium]|jgi:hypothetical protein